VTGGYFADPGVKNVPDLAQCGYPIAEVEPDGSAVITKLAGTGGCVSPATVKEQLLYEVHDPARYLTPDVTADFSRVEVAAEGPDRVKVSNASGSARPDTLKVTVGFDGGFQGEAGVSYAGPAAQERGQLAAAIVAQRLEHLRGNRAELRALPGRFAPSIVPIALGYVVAHYYSLLVLTGQQTVGQLADPLGLGWDLLGLGGRPLLTGWVQPTFVATFQVCAIVVGHVLGVVLAHDRAVALFPRAKAVVGQIPLLCLMVLFTVGGLLLLFAA